MSSSNRPNLPPKQFRKQTRESVTLPGLGFEFTLEEMLALVDSSQTRVLSGAERAKLKAVTMAMAEACKEIDARGLILPPEGPTVR